MRRIQASIVLTLVLVAALAVAGCGSTITAGTAGSGGAVVHTKSVTINGSQMTVLADTSGLTLYYFTADSATSVACSGSCATLWPPLLSGGGAPTSSDSLSGKLDVVHEANGAQVTYNGHPLYAYSKDKSASDTLGQGLFGKWFVATPDLTPLGGAPAAPTPTTSSGY